MNCKPQTEQNQDKAVQLAVRILQYARNELLVALRFMDMALCKLEYQAADVQSIASDGQRLYFQPHYVFQIYQAAPNSIMLICTHCCTVFSITLLSIRRLTLCFGI